MEVLQHPATVILPCCLHQLAACMRWAAEGLSPSSAVACSRRVKRKRGIPHSAYRCFVPCGAIGLMLQIQGERGAEHPGICRVLEVALTPTHLALVLEYAAGGEGCRGTGLVGGSRLGWWGGAEA